MEYKIYPVDAKYVIEAVILKARKEKLGKSFSKNDLENLGISSVYAQNAIKSAEQLNLFLNADKLLSSTNEEKKIIFREHLQKYQPFLDFLSFLMEGLPPLDAAKKLKIIYEIERNEKDIIFTFSNFGRYAGIFVDKKGKLELNESVKTVPPTKLVEIVQNLDNELKARLYIRKLLKDVVNDLSSQEIDDLVFSFLNFEKDPKESIRKAGIVLEDFLRALAEKKRCGCYKSERYRGNSKYLEKKWCFSIKTYKHITRIRGTFNF